MSTTAPGVGGGNSLSGGLTIVGTSAAAGVIIPQTPILHGILPQAGGSSVSFLIVTAAITFIVMIISNLIMRIARFITTHRI